MIFKFVYNYLYKSHKKHEMCVRDNNNINILNLKNIFFLSWRQ